MVLAEEFLTGNGPRRQAAKEVGSTAIHLPD